MKKNTLFLICLSCLFVGIISANAEPPETPPEGMPTAPVQQYFNIARIGNTEITTDTVIDGTAYNSITSNENALLVSGGTSTLTNINVNKSGDSQSEEDDFYGTNAGVLVYNGATLNIEGANIITNGTHANAVFAYGTGIINIKDTSINTNADTSGGIMATGGGTINANNLTINTKGNSSAAIRSDRGGGTIVVSEGTYETDGVGSPAIYSTANITVKDATLTSNKSEGAVIEGVNSITLENTTLNDTNTTLNGNSETYKNIFLYQSMSGDAKEGTSSFTAKNSNITTNKGDTIFVTNTTAEINLENNSIANSDGDFLRIQAGKWGTAEANGGHVALNMTKQNVNGNIIVDNISTLTVNMTSNSNYTGAINSDNTAQSIILNLTKDANITLTNDSYVTELTNEDSINSNINLNGHKLFVNGIEVSASNNVAKKQSKKKSFNKSNILYYAIASISIILFITMTVIFIKKRKEN